MPCLEQANRVFFGVTERRFICFGFSVLKVILLDVRCVAAKRTVGIHAFQFPELCFRKMLFSGVLQRHNLQRSYIENACITCAVLYFIATSLCVCYPLVTATYFAHHERFAMEFFLL